MNKGNASLVLVKAAEIGFDWVDYTTEAYVTFCVIPDGKCVCVYVFVCWACTTLFE